MGRRMLLGGWSLKNRSLRVAREHFTSQVPDEMGACGWVMAYAGVDY